MVGRGGIWRWKQKRGKDYLVVQSTKFIFAAMSNNKISVEQYAATITNRRGHPVSPSYIYRLIRQHIKGQRISVPFNYQLEGAKDRIWIVLP